MKTPTCRARSSPSLGARKIVRSVPGRISTAIRTSQTTSERRQVHFRFLTTAITRMLHALQHYAGLLSLYIVATANQTNPTAWATNCR